ncbi:MAG: zinc ribbon domain-containing protein [Acidobacteriota bacterium]
MYCPKCGTENFDNVNFCRSCRSNLSLVPQALSGQLPVEPTSGKRRQRDRHKPPSLPDGIQKAFVGLGFLFVSLAVMLFAPAGRIWWFWLLIPAFMWLGKGISEIVAAKQMQQPFMPPQPLQTPPQQAIPAPPPIIGYQAPQTGELAQPPPSVTESTTKLFDEH